MKSTRSSSGNGGGDSSPSRNCCYPALTVVVGTPKESATLTSPRDRTRVEVGSDYLYFNDSVSSDQQSGHSNGKLASVVRVALVDRSKEDIIDSTLEKKICHSLQK